MCRCSSLFLRDQQGVPVAYASFAGCMQAEESGSRPDEQAACASADVCSSRPPKRQRCLPDVRLGTLILYPLSCTQRFAE